MHVQLTLMPVFVLTFIDAYSSSSNDPVVRKLQADDGRILNVNEAK